MKVTYPAFCKSKSDRAAYDIAVKGGWEKYVLYPYDLDAIRAGCYFSIETARYVERFISLLRQSKGEWAGQPLELQAWQRDRIVYPLFGWLRPDGTRRYRKGFIFLPKKNGKSTLCAALALYLLYADGEPGAEVYGAAANRENARNVFDEAANMVKASPHLLAKLKVYDATNGVKAIKFPAKNSYFQVLSGDAASSTGKNVHGLIFDELWTQKDRRLWQDLQRGGSSRRQPLMLSITTAGNDTDSLCYAEYTFYKNLLAGNSTDVDEDGKPVAAWSYFGFIAEAEEKDLEDPKQIVKAIAKANLGLGISPKLDTILEDYHKAKNNPVEFNEFKQFHLNMWVQASASAIPLDFWDKGAEPSFRPEDLIGRPCFAGFDKGEVSDWASLTLVFPDDDGIILLPFVWFPEDRSRDRGQKKVSYLQWIKDGLIQPLSGEAVTDDLLEEKIVAVYKRFGFQQCNYDPWGSRSIATRLLNVHSINMIEHPQTMGCMTDPTREFLELVMAGKVRHGGNKLLRWCAGNLAVKRAPSGGGMMPDKRPQRQHGKIDPIVAGILGYAASKGPSNQVTEWCGAGTSTWAGAGL